MKKIRAIGFDWVGVIFKYPGGSFSSLAADFLGVENEQFHRVYSLYNHMVNKGTQGYEEAIEMWRLVLSNLGKINELDRFVEFIRSRPEGIVDQDVLDLIKKLRAAGWKIGLFSNHSLKGAQAFRKQSCAKLFDAALFSSEVGCMKPEPEAFKKLAEALKIPVTELIYIDDNERCLSTAKQVGYLPVLFKDMKTLEDQLRMLGVNW